MKFYNNPPDASALMTSARSFGNYDLASALADLLDNSIKAKAHNVDIRCVRDTDGPIVRILDDGSGMSFGELCHAMRPASTNPEAERAADDLGRFGWGMKSASLSQCRCVTVLTCCGGDLSGAAWDLDDLKDWKMGVLDESEIRSLADPRLLERDGTEIVWTRCDRLSEYGEVRSRGFNEIVAHAKSQLGLIFHRYLSGEAGLERLTICFNGAWLEPADPFMRNHPATQALPSESLSIEGKSIDVQAFILPHYSKLAYAEHERLGGKEGFVRNQGFYIYRQHRLIMHGTWFRLVRHGELSQLVRVAVNIPNSLDALWKITLDKGDAQMPSGLRERLKGIVDGLRKKSGRVYQSRGGRVRDNNGGTPVWSRYVRNGQIRYYVNREHPLLAGLLAADDAGSFVAAIDVIEDCFPSVGIGEDFSARPESMNQSVIDRDRFLNRLDAALPVLLHSAGGTLPALAELLAVTEPWSSQMALVQEHLKLKGWWSNA